ncbi:cobalamin-binding protein, partial [Candidatus Bathyarchaeota archaeon]
EWVRGDVFMVHVLLAANAMKAGMEVVKPLLVGKEERKPLGKVVIGTVEGDIHDLGKNMVAAMLMAEGFEVVDLGVDVPAEKFVEVVREVSPDIVGLSALMSVSMEGQRKTVEALKEAGLKDRVKVIVGGAPVTAEWAEEIGADGYAEDAFEATKVAKKLIGR